SHDRREQLTQLKARAPRFTQGPALAGLTADCWLLIHCAVIAQFNACWSTRVISSAADFPDKALSFVPPGEGLGDGEGDGDAGGGEICAQSFDGFTLCPLASPMKPCSSAVWSCGPQ